MTRYWKVFFWTAVILIVANCWGVIMPLGVEGYPVVWIGFPRTFWSQWGTAMHFQPFRLVIDLTFALVVCHRIARWAERQEGW